MNEVTTTAAQSCQDKVMERIEGERISPRPRSFYTKREITVWGLWGISVIIGALSVAVMAFAFVHQKYALYEATHENFTTFLVDVLPYVWIAAFLLMAAVAVYNLRHTKHGYRYPLWQILLSSMVLSVAGGGALHFLGLGYLVDHNLGKQVSLYASQEKMESQMWQNPKEGRLLGRVSEPIRPPSTLAAFIDEDGLRWMLDVSELSDNERTLLLNQERVKLIGDVSDHNVFLFHTCAVFPWLLDKEPTRSDFEAARTAFELKMQSYEEKAERLANIEDDDGEVCGGIAPVRRMERIRSATNDE